jgi:hypothetical protein
MLRSERLDLVMVLMYASSGPSIDPASDIIVVVH